MTYTHRPEQGPISRRDAIKVILTGVAGVFGAGMAIEAGRKFKDFKALANLGVPDVGGKRVQATAVAPNPNSNPATQPTKQPKKELTKPPEALLATEVQTFAASLGLKESDVTPDISVEPDFLGGELEEVVDTKTSTPLLTRNTWGDWQPANLKELGRHAGMMVGDISEEDAKKKKRLSAEFNKGAIPVGWAWSQPNPPSSDQFDMGILDNDIWFGQSLGMTDFRIASVFSGRGGGGMETIPMWLRNKLKSGISKQELLDDMTKLVQVTVGHLKQAKFLRKPPEIIVVNEPLTPDDPFVGILGEEYVDQMYQVARSIYPEATLMFNMFDAHFSKGANTKMCLRTVERLKGKGLIDTLGHQMHLNIDTMYVSADDVTKTIESYQIPSAITEFTISLDGFKTSKAERFAEQAKAAQVQLGAAFRAGKVKDVTFWGDVDPVPAEPWYREAYMWDSNKNPKPFYYAARRAIRDAVLAS